MEDVVDLPIPRQREADGERGDDFLDLKRAMVFVVQFLRWSAGFDIPSVEHYQVSHLVRRRFLSGRVGVSAHLFLRIVQSLS